MNKIKLVFITLFLSITVILGGCFGGGAATDTILPNYKPYSNEVYAFQYYQDWEILNPGSLLDFPPGTLLAIRDNVKERGRFITNFTITKNPLIATQADAVNYGLQVKNRHAADLVNFVLENEEKINTQVAGADQATLYITFTGKLRPQGDTLRFVQKFAVKGQDGYILTITSALDEAPETLEKAKQTMRTFSLK